MTQDTTKKVCKKMEACSQTLETKLTPLYAKLPHLPQKVIDILVILYQWGSILTAILVPIAVVLALLGITSLSVMGMIATILSSIFYLGAAYLYGKAFKPLKDKKKEGWSHLLLGHIVYMIGGVCAILVNIPAAIGAVVGAIIGLYLLFEVKKEYK